MGATHLNTDAASSAEHPDEDISMQTRFQAPIRHVTPATPEVFSAERAACGDWLASGYFGDFYRHHSGWYEPSDCGAYASDGSSTAVPGAGSVARFSAHLHR